ncbi:MAG: helix-turn-helix transcriptional regulator [Leptolyngbya sp.]|nr:helix-turn-helix transcriptional regulator [Candidatus Melainabacteria bacterium]
MDRKVVSEELSRFFGVLAHPLRVLIIEELRNGELDVTALKDALSVPQASVSQHLGILRANRIVLERREGRHVFYHLRQPELANLVLESIPFISPDDDEAKRILSAINSTKTSWTQGNKSLKAAKRKSVR